MAFNPRSPINNNKTNSIIILDENNEFVSTFGTTSTRGRELAERDLKYKPGRKAFYLNAQKEMVEINWVIGKYNDRILDSDVLPSTCRAHSLLK
jgi:hypothetical protein